MLNSTKKVSLDKEIHSLCDLFVKGAIKEVLNQTIQLIKQFPSSVALHIIEGDALTKLKKFDTAIRSYKTAISLKPDFAVSHFNLGVALQEKGDLDTAISSYETALQINPQYLEALFNIGGIRHEIGDLNGAIDSYKRILAIDPNFSKAYNNMGNALKNKGNVEQAIQYINKAIELKPNYSKAFLEKAICLKSLGRLGEAIDSYNIALKFDPELFEARCERSYTKQIMCDWTGLDKLEDELPYLGITTSWVQPFPLLIMEDHPERQLIRASNYISAIPKVKPIPLPAKPKTPSRKIRIGYFSADFHDHPVSHQISKVFALHDRKKIDVYAYSMRKTNDEMKRRIIKSVDYFKEVSDMTDKEVALLSRKDQLDIAVDLMGYTGGSRSRIFAFRAAPVQINFHGYQSTMGADFIDYIMADPTVIPNRLRGNYQEKIIYLPHSYMPTDNSRKISNKPITRSDMGLPENSFVFCCFNSSEKISPREFDIWMRLLHKVDNSVLWLRQTNLWAKNNLKREAELRGINPLRLIFTERLPTEEHLARHKLANLFLDTFNYNAHSTACDALWAGLPLITKKGDQYVARCAASFLNALDLPELIVKTDHEYEQLALDLAKDKNLLQRIKKKLGYNKDIMPLFDTPTYTKNLEKVFSKAYHQYIYNSYPKDIWV